MGFQLCQWKKSDAKTPARYANNPGISANLTNAFPLPYSEDDAKTFIEFACSHEPLQIFAIEVNGEAAGSIGVFPQSDIHCKNAEMGYWLAEHCWGKGIVSKAVKEMVGYAFRTFDITQVFARPSGSNAASQKVLEKNGFVLGARFEKTLYKNGRFEDELIYAIRLKQYNNQDIHYKKPLV